ncbi:5-hydroxytryptamine receptor 1B-like [Exaiptasia diaphana]|uniref:G-protein coupled receptors family 1 profile domain-containing protein n=1 Tax=Exaiptasia diaphana TaxID=2652724 RepID=A0A913XL19_EXADI|nr:5-hydroxytryptamine receptor 1B-like [Exaiptasia diaphana]
MALNTTSESDPTFMKPCLRFELNLNIEHNSSYESGLITGIVLCILLGIFATLSNLSAIYTILKTSSLHRPSNVLIVGLAISDFFAGIIAYPCLVALQLSDLLQDITKFCALAKALWFTLMILVSVSLLTLTAVALDRFLALHYHMRYCQYVTNKGVAVVLVFIWSYSCLAGVLLVYLNREDTLRAHFIVLFVASLMDIYFLLKIYKTAYRHSRQIQVQHQSVQPSSNLSQVRKSLNVMYFIIVAFVICYLPYVICSGAIGVSSESSGVLVIIYTIAEGLILLNSCINPVIYYWRIEEFRNATRIVFKCIR